MHISVVAGAILLICVISLTGKPYRDTVVEWCAWCHTLKSLAFMMCFVGYVYLNHWPEQYVLTLVTYMYIACPL